MSGNHAQLIAVTGFDQSDVAFSGMALRAFTETVPGRNWTMEVVFNLDHIEVQVRARPPPSVATRRGGGSRSALQEGGAGRENPKCSVFFIKKRGEGPSIIRIGEGGAEGAGGADDRGRPPPSPPGRGGEEKCPSPAATSGQKSGQRGPRVRDPRHYCFPYARK